MYTIRQKGKPRAVSVGDLNSFIENRQNITHHKIRLLLLSCSSIALLCKVWLLSHPSRSTNLTSFIQPLLVPPSPYEFADSFCLASTSKCIERSPFWQLQMSWRPWTPGSSQNHGHRHWKTQQMVMGNVHGNSNKPPTRISSTPRFSMLVSYEGPLRWNRAGQPVIGAMPMTIQISDNRPGCWFVARCLGSSIVASRVLSTTTNLAISAR